MNKSYSSVLKSAPLPVPGYRGPRRFPGPPGQGKPMAPASAKSMAPRNGQRATGNGGHFEGPSNSRFSHYDQAVKEQKRERDNASMIPGRTAAPKKSEPYFASNLKYYPHLPQPRWVEDFQTFAELKKVISHGDHSQVETTMPPPPPPPAKVHKSRSKSVTPAQVYHNQAAQAPPLRYSMTRKNAGDGTENSMNNRFLPVSKHLIHQPNKQMKKPAQQDPLLAQFVARQEEVRHEDDPKKAPRRLQPSWCPSSNEEASGSSKPKDAPRSWRSEGTAHLLPKKSVAENSLKTRKEK